MNNANKAFLLGLFIIVALVLATWLVLFIKPAVGDGKVLLTVRFSNIDKISKGTLVTFGGRQVGKVKEIREIPDPRSARADAFGNLYMYELDLQVDSSVKVYLYDEIIFASAGLLGEKSIAIVPKAAPPGSPPPYEVTNDVLYARSTDKLEQALQKLIGVADTFKDTLEEVNIFVETNNKDLNIALKSVSSVAGEMKSFIASARDKELLENMAKAMNEAQGFFATAKESSVFERAASGFESIGNVASIFQTGEGTLARLAKSDNLYLQLSSTLYQFETVLSDLSNFGLLYQFNSKWKRLSEMRRRCTENPCCMYGQE